MCSGRRSRGCSGRSSSTLRRRRAGSTGRPQAAAAAASGHGPQPRLGAPVAPTSSRCPTSGSTRGSRRGTSRSTRSRSRWSTSTSRRGSSSCCQREAAAPERANPGVRVAVRRRQPAGAGVGGVAGVTTSRSTRGDARRPVPRARANKLLLNFTWWVNRKDARGGNVFQGGFLGLDNISRLRPVAAAAGRRVS